MAIGILYKSLSYWMLPLTKASWVLSITAPLTPYDTYRSSSTSALTRYTTSIGQNMEFSDITLHYTKAVKTTFMLHIVVQPTAALLIAQASSQAIKQLWYDMDQAWSTRRTNYLQVSHHTISIRHLPQASRDEWYGININVWLWSTWTRTDQHGDHSASSITLRDNDYDHQDTNVMVSTSMEKDSSRWRRPGTTSSIEWTTSWCGQDQQDGQGLIYISNWSSTTCQLLHTGQLIMYNIIQPNYFCNPVSYLWTKQELTLSRELEY